MDIPEIIKCDRKNNSTISFIILFLYRIENLLYKNNHRIILRFARILHFIVSVILNIDAQISYEAQLGCNIRLPHRASGVVISHKARIGNNVTIYHQVTIGINERKPIDQQRIIIGDNCYLSTGCKIISCVVGKNCKIAPNAVVFKDILPNNLVYCVNETKPL